MARIKLLSVALGRIHEPGNPYWLTFDVNYGYLRGNDRNYKLEYCGTEIIGCLFSNDDDLNKLELMMQRDFGMGPFSPAAVARAARQLRKDYDTDDFSVDEAD